MWTMLVLLLICFSTACSFQIPEDTEMISNSTAEGNIWKHCHPFYTRSIPLKVKLEMTSPLSWITLEVKSPNLTLDSTLVPYLLLPASVNRNSNETYFCSVDDRAAEYNLGVDDYWKDEQVFCQAAQNWTSLSWSRDGEVIAVVKRGGCPLNIKVEGNGSSLYVMPIIPQDDSDISCPGIGSRNVTCNWVDLQSTLTGFQIFLEERYWIIVAVALGYVMFCLVTMSIYMCMRRKRRGRERVKASFFKASVAKNLYIDSLNQDPGDQKRQELTYQNVAATLPKNVPGDCYSEKSSFLDQSLDGDSYLQPDEADQLFDGDGYENTVQDIDVPEGSIDGDCYENAAEEIKDGSVGSVSYEDMQGSICTGNKGEATWDVELTQEEDADSYENMETPIYSEPNVSLNTSAEEPSKESTPSLRNRETELKQQNGDFYVSYESKKL